MKSFLRKILNAGLVLLVLTVAAGTVVWLRQEHYGPWATGGPNRAILDATFGMSEEEVERATKLTLMGCHEAKDQIRGSDGTRRPSVEFYCDFGGVSVDREEFERTEFRFINSIELFGAPCWLMFTFFDGRLAGVKAEFEPYKDAATFVDTIQSELQASGYTFEKRDESESYDRSSTIYRTTYRQKTVVAFLVFNPTPKDPTISLFLDDSEVMEVRKQEKAARDKSVF